MQAMEKKGKECRSLPAGLTLGKAMQTQKGLLMGQPQNVGRRPRTPEAVQSGSILASLLSLGKPQEVKEEPDDESGQVWETQWQDFLSTVEVSSAPSRVPKFPPESTPWDDAEAFLAAFEQVAGVFRWPREEWVARLLPTLTGEAELIFSSLEAGDRDDYGKVKAALLQEDATSRERSRQRFRNFCYQEAVGPREAYGRLRELCSRWLKIEKHSKEQILEAVILEQFVAILPPVIQKWVKEHQAESGVQAVSLAEDFLRRRWLSGVKEEQATHPQGEGSMNFAEEEQVSFSTGAGPQLRKESKTEDLTDFSDAYLSDDGEEGDDNDSLTQGSSHQTEPQVIVLESDSNPLPFCDQEKGDLRKSVVTCEDGRKNLCSECGKCFPHKLSLRQHQRKHHISHLPEKPPKHLTSGGGSCYKTDLESYQKILTGEYPCVCLHCGEKFTSRTSLLAHQKIHRGENLPFSLPEVTVYICNECGETFSRLEDHNVHQRSHRGMRLGASVGCQKKTERPSNQGNPLIVCTNEEPYRCTDCGESFVRLSTYRIHQIAHARSKPGSLLLNTPPWSKYCPVCQKAFPDYWKLMRHCASHKKPQEIEMCAVFLKQIPVQRRRRGMRQKSFPCSECGKTFRWHVHLMRHKLIHSREKPYKCMPSGQRFMSSLSLGQHRNMVHKGGKPVPKFPNIPGKSSTCPTCGKSFKNYLARAVHERIHKGGKLHTCSRCGKGFMLRKSLVSHEKKVHQVNTGGRPLAQAPKTGKGHLACSNCSRQFKNPECLERHQRVHTGEKLCQCSECGESFLWEGSLVRHRMKVHKVKKPLQKGPRKDPPQKMPDQLLKKTSSSGQKKLYTCAECGKCFNWPSHFKMHQNVHMKTKLFQCKVCGKAFQWEGSLDRHRKKFHHGGRKIALPQTGPSKQKEIHFCHDCGKFFKKRWYLVRHRRLLHPEQNVIDLKPRAYRCFKCGMNFSSLLGLVRHKDVHGKEKPYKCTDCGKDFTQSSALGMHKEKVHRGKKLVPVLQRLPDLQGKPFKCSEQPGLATRQATQLGKDCHACSECGKILSCRSSLRRHRVLHSGVKSFKCDHCWRTFFYKENLVRHQRVHNRFQKFTMEAYENNLQVKMNSGSQAPTDSSPPYVKSEDISYLWEETVDKCTAQVEELMATGGPPLHVKSEDTFHLQEEAGNESAVHIGELPLTGGTSVLTVCSLPHEKSEDTSQLQEELGDECTVHVGELPQTDGSLALIGGWSPHKKSEDTSLLQEVVGDECTVQVGELPLTGGSPALTDNSPPHEKSENTSQLWEEAGKECTVQVGELPQTGISPAPTGSSPPQEKSENTSQLQEEAGNECTVQVGELFLTSGSLAPTGGSPLHEKSEDAFHLQEEAGNEYTVQAGELLQTDGSPAPTGFSPTPTSGFLPHEKSEDASHLWEEGVTGGSPVLTGSSPPREKSENTSLLREEAGDEYTVRVGESPLTGGSLVPTGGSLLHEKSEDASNWWEEPGNECTVQAGELPLTDDSPVPTGFFLPLTSGSLPHEKSEDPSHLWEEAGNKCTVQVGELPLTGGAPGPSGNSLSQEKSEDTSHLREEASNECTVQVGELPLTGVSLPHEKSEDAFHWWEEAANECTVQARELPPTDSSLVPTGFSPALTSGSMPHEKSEDASHLWQEEVNRCTVQVVELPLIDLSPVPTGSSMPHEKSENASHWWEEAGDECTVQAGELPPTDGSPVPTDFPPAATSSSPPHEKSEVASHLWEEAVECTVQVGELPLTGGSLGPTCGSLPQEEETSYLREEAGDKCTVQVGELLLTGGSLAPTGGTAPQEKSEDASRWREEAGDECTVNFGSINMISEREDNFLNIFPDCF